MPFKLVRVFMQLKREPCHGQHSIVRCTDLKETQNHTTMPLSMEMAH